jgi:hypothetical protein
MAADLAARPSVALVAVSDWVAGQATELGVRRLGNWADLKNTSLASGDVGANNIRIDAIGLFGGQLGYTWSSVL